MKIRNSIGLRTPLTVGVLAFFGLVSAEEEPVSTFDTCLEELKRAVTNSTEEENGNEYVPDVSLEESIRIYDECLRREGITLSIDSGLGSGSGTGGGSTSASGNNQESSSAESTSNESKNGSSATQQSMGESSSTPSPNGQSSDLESSIQDFDSMLSQVQQELDAERAEHLAQQLAQSNSQAQAIAQSTNSSSQQSQSNEDGGPAADVEDMIESPSAMVSADGKHEDKTKRTPLDPLDEDIILKTIREAAEMEADPTTKEALWDQYYEYANKSK